MATSVLWHGTQTEALELLQALSRNCSCVVTAEGGAKLPRLGDRLEFVVPHCDPTTNLHDRIYAMREDRVEAVWPLVARRESRP